MSRPDITINRSSDHFRALFDFATLGILITDSRGVIIEINPFALNEFGYTEKELVNQRIEMLIPSRYWEKHDQELKKYFEKPQSRPMGSGLNLFALRKDGTEFPVEISLSHYENGGKKYVIAFINNVTARKESEAKFEKLNTELENTIEKRTRDLEYTMRRLEISNDMLGDSISFQKAILDNAGAMIIVTDKNGLIKYFNPEASRNTGYSESEVINKTSPLLFHDKNEIAREREKLFAEFGITIEGDIEVMMEKTMRNIHHEQQYTYIRKDGTTFPVLLTITCIRGNESEITGFMGVAIDVSARKKAEEDLRGALKKEKELGELKSRFVTMASHEFRTPLSTVLSSAYLIEKYAASEDQPKREKHLHRIISSVNVLTDILNDFLSLGKIEEGKIQIRPTQFDILALVTSVVGEIKSSLKAQQKILYHHTGTREVLLDPTLLKHVIMNLISNASKFSPEGSSIELKTITHADWVTLSVKDHGMGISREDQKHLMERFFRGLNAGNIQGTGLGLHIVSKYAELMDGTVKCISELEKGTEFVIKFNAKMD